MPSFVDLHTHTTASDGTYTPAELVRCAEECGLSAVAVTDHDTVSGLGEAHAASEGLDIEVISGIEIGAQFDGEMHILGLFIDPYAAVLQGALQELMQWRAERNETMIQRICDMGIKITREDVLAQKQSGDMSSVGRMHMAAAIAANGYAGSPKEAFDRYLCKDGAAYVARKRFLPQRCIEIIKSSGGYAFLAHPIHLECDHGTLCKIIEELKEYGLDGVECYHSSHTYEFSEMCAGICRGCGLMISGGSDFHGANKPDVKLGQAGEGQYIELDVLAEIKRRIGMTE